ncbi:hypothetical protein AVEN_206964-1 [Araneus ventricosus]|uniref:Uncharacterized protein n=1 Tax=Araneus ventricosus TaxID=182803 RepID=A0A4Y2S3U1_ARAVE|nr:hypothetical protein AVEN_206964-1 [Araneus ventricosus]
MAYLARSRKEDLLLLAEELGLTVKKEFKVKQLHKLITESPSYDEEFTRELLGSIKEERSREFERDREKEAREEREREREERERERDRAFELQNLNWKSELHAHSPFNLCIYLIDLLKSECAMLCHVSILKKMTKDKCYYDTISRKIPSEEDQNKKTEMEQPEEITHFEIDEDILPQADEEYKEIKKLVEVDSKEFIERSQN